MKGAFAMSGRKGRPCVCAWVAASDNHFELSSKLSVALFEPFGKRRAFATQGSGTPLEGTFLTCPDDEELGRGRSTLTHLGPSLLKAFRARPLPPDQP